MAIAMNRCQMIAGNEAGSGIVWPSSNLAGVRTVHRGAGSGKLPCRDFGVIQVVRPA